MWQKLDEQNPILWKQYISLFDKDILLFLKQVEFLDPIHSIHFLSFKLCWWSSGDFSYVSMPQHNGVFLEFFLDPIRSGKYHLTAEHHADIVAWMIQYYYPLPKDIVLSRSGLDSKATIQTHCLGFRSPWSDEITYLPIDIHLSRASLCAERLMETIRAHNPRTFLLVAHSEPEVCSIVVQYYSQLIFKKSSFLLRLQAPSNHNLLLDEKHREKVRKGIARYLLVRCIIIIQFWNSYTSNYRITA